MFSITAIMPHVKKVFWRSRLVSLPSVPAAYWQDCDFTKKAGKKTRCARHSPHTLHY